jgi:3-hydroxyanthranilate 3,4-dioxygenase
MLNTFKQAVDAGPYDEYPVLPPGVDPQLFLSRNDRPQPFYLVCEKDTMLIQMSGTGVVEFRDSSVNFFKTAPGDHIYVPAGTPHRITPNGVAIQYRYKAEQSGLEAVAWYCLHCGAALHRETWDTGDVLPQEGYLRATTAFNTDSAKRTCAACGHVHPTIDLDAFRWATIARELREGDSGDEQW